MWPYYLALLGAVLFKVGGDGCLGQGRRVPGVLLTALHFGLYAFCLQRLPVTFANPVTAFTIVLGTLYAQRYLHEHVGPRRWTGVAFVTLGAILVGSSAI